MNSKVIGALAVTAAFAILRFVLPVSGSVNHADIFKDLAHVWVGILFGVGLSRIMATERGEDLRARHVNEGFFLILGILLTGVEVVAFAARHN